MSLEKTETVNIIRHLAFEDLGSFASVLQAKGTDIHYIEAGYDELSQLDPLSDELLVILGGPISVNDAGMFPFIDEELALLKQRIAADKPTLGICLGAQLIAASQGAKIYSGEEKEIGWYPLQLTEAGERSALRYLGEQHCSMLHWHGETFDLPEGATLLASTQKFTNQAFSIGRRVLGLQFHPEITRHGMEKWFIGHIGEIMQTPGISVEQLRADTAKYADQLEVQGELFFQSWLGGLD
ncbi:MAG TPA: glutamine amidotransferase [Gammaproteobacteria bacterium]|nr:glutamine amidotransferase [Gammaproteobacteria bacterium]